MKPGPSPYSALTSSKPTCAHLDGTGLTSDPQGPLFHTLDRGTRSRTRSRLPQTCAPERGTPEVAQVNRRTGNERKAETRYSSSPTSGPGTDMRCSRSEKLKVP